MTDDTSDTREKHGIAGGTETVEDVRDALEDGGDSSGGDDD
jgi:hypothetical protein